jgi:peptide chain release factor subunit 1
VVAITEDDIRSLAAFKGVDAPVTSCYLDVDGGHQIRHQDLEQNVDRLLRAAAARNPDQPSVAADLKRVADLVKGGFDRSRTRGLAVFACSAHDFWQVFELPVAVRNQVVVNHSPYVRQLELVVDEYERFGLLLADKRRARVIVYELGEIVDSRDVSDELPWGDDAGDHSVRRDDLVGHADAAVHHHLRRAADTAFEVFKERAFERLVIGAPEEIIPELEALLHPYLKERLEARCSVAVGASDDEIRSAALAVQADVERRKEAEAVARLRDEVGAGRRGVAGLDATLLALVERRVDTLLVSTGFTAPGWRCPSCGWMGRVGRACPVCQQAMDPSDEVVEEAVEEALAQSCDVDVCVGNADLDVLGGIGALLRY